MTPWRGAAPCGERRRDGTRSSAPWATLTIAACCALAFALGGPDLAQIWGFDPLAFSRRPWSAITALFAHVNAHHLVSNLIVLTWSGWSFERLAGPRRTLLAFLACGMGGWLVLTITAEAGMVPAGTLTAGASGAMLGLAAAAVLMRGPGLNTFLLTVSVTWILATSFTGAVSWQAHVGGVLTGVAIGVAYMAERRRPPCSYDADPVGPASGPV
jgi:membrane associated rhomboid family serine protease